MADDFEAAGARLHVVPMRRITSGGSFRWWAAYLAGWPLSVLRLCRLARKVGADVVYTNSLHSWYGWAVAALCRRPHVWHAREIVVQSRAALGLERFLTRHFADEVVAMSAAIARQLEPRRVTVIYEAPDATAFSPAKAGSFRKSAGIPDDVPLAGAVGRVDTWKGFDTVLDAVPLVREARPDASFVIAGPVVRGKEAYAAALEDRAASLPGVFWLGPRRDVAELMADLDVFVLSSTEPEPYGLVLVEAMACGVPVVATAAGGPLEILAGVAPEMGHLVAPGDAAALADAVNALLPDATSTDSRRRRRPLPAPSSPDDALAKVFAVAVESGGRIWRPSPRHAQPGGSSPAGPTARLRLAAGRIGRFVLPIGAPRRQWVSRRVRAGRNRWFQMRGLPPNSVAPSYEKWLRRRTPSADDLAAQRRKAASWPYRPMISVCLAVGDGGPGALERTLASVEAQSYDHWELCVAPGPAGSAGAVTQRVLDRHRGQVARLKLAESPTSPGEGLAAAMNRAFDLAEGEFVAVLDDRGFVAPHALYLMARELQAEPATDVLYCDEDVLSPSGARIEPLLKPPWNRELLLSTDYLGRFLVARRTLVEEVGGMRPEREGARDHDLALRLTEKASRIAHVPEVLYTVQGGAGTDGDARRAELDTEAVVVADALRRRAITGIVEVTGAGRDVRVRYGLPRPAPHVEILVPTRDRLDLLRPCLESVQKHTEYPDFSVSVVDNDSADPATMEFVRSLGINVIPAPGPFNYSAIVNRAIARTSSEFVVTLNNDTLLVDDQWLRGLIELGIQPDVGAVGCRLTFSSGALQHEGIVIGHRVAAQNLAFETPGIRPELVLRSPREVSAVTGACCLMRRSAWEAIGGFDESLAVAYNDVDYCLRLNRRGYRVLYTPYVSVIHDEHATRGAWHPPEDDVLFRQRWGLDFAQGLVTCDEFFSPHLVLGRWGWQLAPDLPQW